MIRVSFSRKLFLFVNTIFLALIAIACVIPFTHIIFASFSDPYEVMKTEGILFWPKQFTVGGYRLVFSKPLLITGYRNTLFITTVGTTLSILLTSCGAYVLSKRNVYWNKVFMKIVTIPMFIGGGMVPFYLLVDSIGLNGKIWAVIIPYIISSWNMLVMRAAFRGVPESVEESAKIDGASDLIILFRIALPMILPTVAVMILFYALGYWNSWFPGVLFLRDRSLFPLQLIMREILLQDSVGQLGTAMELQEVGSEHQEAGAAYYLELLKYTTIVLTTVPIMCLYPFIQKYFVKGIMVGSLKE
jgi:putative aldouronate transport system permease protein